MKDINAFIEHYRPKLLEYIDAKTSDIPDLPGPLKFVDDVLDSWHEFADNRRLEAPGSLERTFWFALYQLESTAEFPATEQLHPYEVILLQNLAEVRELLRHRKGLPKEFFASRPGE